jgi:mechanosensitive ion channel protein 4/5/6/7/8/9/10
MYWTISVCIPDLLNYQVKAYLDRKSLAHSLNDIKTAVMQLHDLTSVIDL